MLKRARSIVACAVAALCLWAQVIPGAARDFRAADIQSADYPTVQAIEFLGRLIRERTGGRHNVRVFHSGQLGEEGETIIQTRAGAIDINRINVAPMIQYVPELNVLAAPFLFASNAHLHRVLDGPVGAELLARLEKYGFIGLAFYDSGARSFYTNKPVKDFAGMKGLRIRVQQSRMAEDMVRAMGAIPVVIAYSQVLTSLTTAIVDGAENNWPSYVTTNHFIQAKHYLLTEHTMAPELLLMSKVAWDLLSQEDQTIFKTASRESTLFMRKLWQDWEERSRMQANAAGNTILQAADRAAFAGAMAPIHAELEKNAEQARLIRLIREAQ